MFLKADGHQDFLTNPKIMNKIILTTYIFLFVIITAMSLKGVAMGKIVDYESTIRNKAKEINLKDGVNKKEAILLAQKELLDSKYKDKYDIMKTSVNYDKDSDTWGIEFKLKKGCEDEDYWGVLIKRDTGEIYSGPLRDL